MLWIARRSLRMDALEKYTKDELIEKYLNLEDSCIEKISDLSSDLEESNEELKALYEIAIKHIDERTEMRKEITKLKGNK